jgi:hypothetical protein
LRKTVRKLEVACETKSILNDDEREAQRVAEQLGFSVEVTIVRPGRDNATGRARRKLAQVLRARNKWSVSRIARTLHICERSAWRLVS